MVNDYMLDKVLDKIKEHKGIANIDDFKVLIDTNNKLPDYITFIIVVMLIRCIIKYDGISYPQILLEEGLYRK